MSVSEERRSGAAAAAPRTSRGEDAMTKSSAYILWRVRRSRVLAGRKRFPCLGSMLVTLFAVLIFATVSAEAAPTFGTPFLFPDNILDDGVGVGSGVFLDVGVNAIKDPNGVASARAVPSQAG